MRPRFHSASAWITAAACLAIAPHRAVAGTPLFEEAPMKEVALDGVRVRYGKPVEVTAQIGWQTSWVDSAHKPVWSFVHLTPFLARFPGGNLLATYTDDSDADDNPFYLSAFQVSADGGAHWRRRYPLLMQHIAMVYIPVAPNSLLAVSSEWTFRTKNDRRNFVAPSYLFEEGGAKLLTEPEGARIVDWPWDALPDGNGGAETGSPQPPENWHVSFYVTGNALEAGGRWIATGYCKKGGEKFYTAVLIASDDGGRTWRYLSTIAAPDRARDEKKDGYEGPNEDAIVRLADGDVMAVVRIGSGLKLVRCYSHDGGRSWTKDEPIPAFSVSPQLWRTNNGVILLATGRPGIGLWVSTDPRAKRWQFVDVVACHNAWAPANPDLRISRIPAGSRKWKWESWQTSAYTGMVEVAPNRIVLIYDRDPEWQPESTHDLSRAFVMPIEIVR